MARLLTSSHQASHDPSRHDHAGPERNSPARDDRQISTSRRSRSCPNPLSVELGGSGYITILCTHHDRSGRRLPTSPWKPLARKRSRARAA
ncbi:hypothetical protein A0H81_13493 [Grifola frondosa]|uniref:Uncharacterized protein n=1 Tax=Grifola frondosa TaxID=5627 RepID=A0A1C7LPK7_GRIFR|nr:hypothetical protein A0H81_13493 [Grifola frondosa]